MDFVAGAIGGTGQASRALRLRCCCGLPPGHGEGQDPDGAQVHRHLALRPGHVPARAGEGLLQGPLAAHKHGVAGLVAVFRHLPPVPHTHLPVPVRQRRRQARQDRHHALRFRLRPRPCVPDLAYRGGQGPPADAETDADPDAAAAEAEVLGLVALGGGPRVSCPSRQPGARAQVPGAAALPGHGGPGGGAAGPLQGQLGPALAGGTLLRHLLPLLLHPQRVAHPCRPQPARCLGRAAGRWLRGGPGLGRGHPHGRDQDSPAGGRAGPAALPGPPALRGDQRAGGGAAGPLQGADAQLLPRLPRQHGGLRVLRGRAAAQPGPAQVAVPPPRASPPAASEARGAGGGQGECPHQVVTQDSGEPPRRQAAGAWA